MKVSRTLLNLCLCSLTKPLYSLNYLQNFLILFEYLNQKNITEKQSNNSISNSSSELDVLYLQISECLEQWPAKKSQNYFELKHHFELLHILRNENYKGEAVAFISKRAKEVLAASKTYCIIFFQSLHDKG